MTGAPGTGSTAPLARGTVLRISRSATRIVHELDAPFVWLRNPTTGQVELADLAHLRAWIESGAIRVECGSEPATSVSTGR